MFAPIPPWVPFVLLGLVVLGYRLSATRLVNPKALLAVALAMLVFSLVGVTKAFGASALALLLWAGGYLAAAVAGAKRIAAGGALALVGPRVRLPGSWLPMALLLGIFVAKFVLGFAAGVRSPLLHDAVFVALMSTLLGALSGGFGARAFAVHRFAGAAAEARTA